MPRRRVAFLPVYPTLATLPVWLETYKRAVEPVVDHAYAVVCHENPEVVARAYTLLEPHFDIVTDHHRWWAHGDCLNSMLAYCGTGDDILLLEDDCFVGCTDDKVSHYFEALDHYDFVGANDNWTSEPAQTIGMQRFPETGRDPLFDSWGPGVLPTMFWCRYETLAQTKLDCNGVNMPAGTRMPEIGIDLVEGDPIGLDTMQWLMWQLRHQHRTQLRTNAYRLSPFPGIEVNGATPGLDISKWPWVHSGCIAYMSNSILGAPGSEANLCNSNLFEVPMACIRACMDLWQGRDRWYDTLIPLAEGRIEKQRQWADWPLYERLRVQWREYLNGAVQLRDV